MIALKLEDKDVIKFTEIFRKFDRNGDGLLAKGEFKKGKNDLTSVPRVRRLQAAEHKRRIFG